ncbi:hypothetical protein B484DRAFT_168623 [Ochromonadaceae sp. CCMP2298]|nr:hypothetical protein B484DRAFT_168623 [Ochromonadaceae sp. CCMP2298]
MGGRIVCWCQARLRRRIFRAALVLQRLAQAWLRKRHSSAQRVIHLVKLFYLQRRRATRVLQRRVRMFLTLRRLRLHHRLLTLLTLATAAAAESARRELVRRSVWEARAVARERGEMRGEELRARRVAEQARVRAETLELVFWIADELLVDFVLPRVWRALHRGQRSSSSPD